MIPLCTKEQIPNDVLTLVTVKGRTIIRLVTKSAAAQGKSIGIIRGVKYDEGKMYQLYFLEKEKVYELVYDCTAFGLKVLKDVLKIFSRYTALTFVLDKDLEII